MFVNVISVRCILARQSWNHPYRLFPIWYSLIRVIKRASFTVLSVQAITRGNIIEASLFSYDLNLCRWGFMSWMALWYILNTSSKWMSTCFTSAATDRYFIRLNCLVSMEPWSCGLITSSIMQGSVCECMYGCVCVCVCELSCVPLQQSPSMA